MLALRRLILPLCIAVFPAHSAQRTFVASFGKDANVVAGCTLVEPCRSFAAALNVTDTGGEVVALDAAGYGAVTITSSVTLTANPGVYAGIAAFSGNAVTIAAAGVRVTLQGLHLNGQGATRGIYMTNGAQLIVDNCVISNFNSGGNGAAIHVAPEYGDQIQVRISDSDIRHNRDGVLVQGDTRADIFRTKFTANHSGVYVNGDNDGTTARASVIDSIASANFYGYKAQAQAGTTGNAYLVVRRSTASSGSLGVAAMKTAGGSVSVVVGQSVVTHNSDFGLYNSAANLESEGDNTVQFNEHTSFGTISSAGRL